MVIDNDGALAVSFPPVFDPKVATRHRGEKFRFLPRDFGKLLLNLPYDTCAAGR